MILLSDSGVIYLIYSPSLLNTCHYYGLTLKCISVGAYPDSVNKLLEAINVNDVITEAESEARPIG